MGSQEGLISFLVKQIEPSPFFFLPLAFFESFGESFELKFYCNIRRIADMHDWRSFEQEAIVSRDAANYRSNPTPKCLLPSAAYGTAQSGVGVAPMGVMWPDLVMKSIVPVVMAGVLGIDGLSTGINPKAKPFTRICSPVWSRLWPC